MEEGKIIACVVIALHVLLQHCMCCYSIACVVTALHVFLPPSFLLPYSPLLAVASQCSIFPKSVLDCVMSSASPSLLRTPITL